MEQENAELLCSSSKKLILCLSNDFGLKISSPQDFYSSLDAS